MATKKNYALALAVVIDELDPPSRQFRIVQSVQHPLHVGVAGELHYALVSASEQYRIS